MKKVMRLAYLLESLLVVTCQPEPEFSCHCDRCAAEIGRAHV